MEFTTKRPCLPQKAPWKWPLLVVRKEGITFWQKAMALAQKIEHLQLEPAVVVDKKIKKQRNGGFQPKNGAILGMSWGYDED